jgi:hypothetical protein
MPITVDTTEVAAKIPQKHELINQTSMTADSKGRPYIATYWREEGTDVPRYHIVYHDGTRWNVAQVGGQTIPFRLSGVGSKRLPLSRPKVFADSSGPTDKAYMLFRGEARGNKVSVAKCSVLKAPAQLAQELAIVRETKAQHLGDGDHVLTDGDLAQNLLVDVFGTGISM